MESTALVNSKGVEVSTFTVVGSGAIGSGVAHQLADLGHEVTVITRRGLGPTRAGVRIIAADASDTPRLRDLCAGSDALFNCVNPPYHRWITDWPPIATSLLEVASATGATLCTMSNLYAYGEPNGPMSPHDPLTATYAKAQVRAQMWRDALRAHESGRVRAVEVRASDFIGAGAQSMVGDRLVPRILAGKSCSVIGRTDVAHSWTFIDDVAATLVACALDPSSWGRAWHAPTNAPRTTREVIDDLAAAAGVAPVTVRALGRRAIALAGLVSPSIREMRYTLYQFERPFVIDDSETREHFAVNPTPWPLVLDATIAPHLASAQRVA